MTTEQSKPILKKKYRIKWITEINIFGREDIIVGHEIIETAAQHTFNLLVDMFSYKSPYSK